MKIRILGKNPWHPSRRIGSDAALFACGRKRPTNGNGKLVRPVSEARCGERCEHGRAAGFRNGKGIGVRNAAFRAPKASNRPRLRVIQCFGSPNDSGPPNASDLSKLLISGRLRFQVTQGFGPPKASDHPRLRVIQGFWSPNDSGRLRLQVAQGFGPSKAPGHPRLQVAQISGFQSSLMRNRKKKGGYRPFSTIEFDVDVKKTLFREFRASFLLYSQRNCP